jgi:peptide/nickel transport system permease protein
MTVETKAQPISLMEIPETPVRQTRRRRPVPSAALVGLGIVLIYLTLAILGEAVAPFSPTAQNFSATLQPPSLQYPFGTDQFGRDIFSRVIVGSRSVMLLASISTALALLLGGLIGLVAGYVGGLWEEILMRAMDVLLSFPVLLLALFIISTLGSETIFLVLTVGVVFAPGIARVVHSAVIGLIHMEFVEAARAVGAPPLRIALRHLLPNLSGLFVVEGTIYFSYAILVSAGLGFLGLGVQPPSPDWGLQVNDGRNFILTAWWITVFPSLAISSLVLGVNLLADGLTKQKRH